MYGPVAVCSFPSENIFEGESSRKLSIDRENEENPDAAAADDDDTDGTINALTKPALTGVLQ